MKKLLISLILLLTCILLYGCNENKITNPPEEYTDSSGATEVDTEPVTDKPLNSIRLPEVDFSKISDEDKKMIAENEKLFEKNFPFEDEVKNGINKKICETLYALSVKKIKDISYEEDSYSGGYRIAITDNDNKSYYIVLNENGFIRVVNKDSAYGELIFISGPGIISKETKEALDKYYAEQEIATKVD
ncbi:hypothetical protein AGMMS50284_7670 [Clostridia bacterium]|nr:hypothetical protein AGMMS50284_7670 [Clostridia bacterium]